MVVIIGGAVGLIAAISMIFVSIHQDHTFITSLFFVAGVLVLGFLATGVVAALFFPLSDEEWEEKNADYLSRKEE